MEHTQQDLLEELLLVPKGDNWSTLLGGGNDEIFSPIGWNSNESFDDHYNQDLAATTTTSNSSSLLGLNNISSPSQSAFAFPFGEPYSFSDGFSTIPDFGSSYKFPDEYNERIHHLEDGQFESLLGNGLCKVELEQHNASIDAFTIGSCGEEKKSKSKKVEGQPSKNLMAERRRRKRLNDRLSMLRSIVPKISKMDRTSILGDTIDYMKELLDKIQNLREENEEEHRDQMRIIESCNERKPNELLTRNPPKFDVERRNMDTRIEICCTQKPGMLLSTVSTLEALGLDIQQCVISSFSDFSLQASCSEVVEHRGFVSSEDIKQALFRNAGYGGRCL